MIGERCLGVQELHIDVRNAFVYAKDEADDVSNRAEIEADGGVQLTHGLVCHVLHHANDLITDGVTNLLFLLLTDRTLRQIQKNIPVDSQGDQLLHLHIPKANSH